MPGIGQVAPVVLRIVRETATLYLQQEVEARTSLATPEALYDFWRLRLGGLPYEVFQVAYLDTAYTLLRDGVETLEEGAQDRAAVYPAKVMAAALKRGASTVVFAHNHPNGNVTPSEQDKVLTRTLVLAAATLQIKVWDHLVVSHDDVFSFRNEGLL